MVGATGAVGSLLVQMAQGLGLGPIVGTAGSPEGEATLQKTYGIATLNHKKDKFLDGLADMMDLGLAKRPFNGKPSFDLIDQKNTN